MPLTGTVYISLEHMVLVGFTLFVWYEFFASMSMFEILIVLRVLTILVGGWLLFQLMTECSEDVLVSIDDGGDHESIAEITERVKTDPPSPKVTEKSTEFADLLKENPDSK